MSRGLAKKKKNWRRALAQKQMELYAQPLEKTAREHAQENPNEHLGNTCYENAFSPAVLTLARGGKNVESVGGREAGVRRTKGKCRGARETAKCTYGRSELKIASRRVRARRASGGVSRGRFKSFTVEFLRFIAAAGHREKIRRKLRRALAKPGDWERHNRVLERLAAPKRAPKPPRPPVRIYNSH